MNYRYRLAQSQHPAARILRRLYWGVQTFSLPAPRYVIKPMLWAYLALRELYYFAMRVCICEPLFKAACRRHGRRLRTGVFIHWIKGKGDIVIGDDVEFGGKCDIMFAARFTPNPTLEVGDRTCVRGTTFSIGRRISIGNDCLIAMGVKMFDSNGHQSDPEARLAGLPPEFEDVRPITIADNVWIGQMSIVTPGVNIGEGSIVSAGSVVLGDVPPYTVVAGYPARKIGSLRDRRTPESPVTPLLSPVHCSGSVPSEL
ncbi:Hexapeptide repeat of succinyl-transferase [Singulisphaera sp. GP187]|uniref:acyltransferase n=1 Tax=Singulisphaera sp. GP187 TaxID=1882752 RepID=UPI000927A45E|nr:acyltransferase [Singulisphaera sp. GP187]SIO61456.1 Hexapeptide repeat of succinyl-transferase [Singulisphaera sp. GP187]